MVKEMRMGVKIYFPYLHDCLHQSQFTHNSVENDKQKRREKFIYRESKQK